MESEKWKLGLRIVEIFISDERGGAETVVHDLSKFLIKKGLDVKVFLIEEALSFFKDFKKENIVSIGPFFRKFKSDNRFLNYFFFFLNRFRNWIFQRLGIFLKRIKKSLLKFNPDILHIHLNIALKFFLQINFKFDFPVVFTLHGDWGLDTPYRKINFTEYNTLMNIAFKKIDYITSTCEYFFKIIDESGLNINRNKKKIILNGIDLNRIKKIKPLNLDNEIKILFGGGGRFEKGGDILIKALPIIKKEIQNFKLYLLRDIKKHHYIRKYVNKYNLGNYVKFIGFVDYPNYFRYIKAMDIAIVPSRTESIPVCILEYMYCGTPVVATNIGGTPEIIKNNETGILVKPDPKSIARGIIYLCRNPDLKKRLIINGLEISKKYSWDIISDQYLSFFNKILSKSV